MTYNTDMMQSVLSQTDANPNTTVSHRKIVYSLRPLIKDYRKMVNLVGHAVCFCFWANDQPYNFKVAICCPDESNSNFGMQICRPCYVRLLIPLNSDPARISALSSLPRACVHIQASHVLRSVCVWCSLNRNGNAIALFEYSLLVYHEHGTCEHNALPHIVL